VNNKRAYTIAEISQLTGLGRTRLFGEIRSGRLRATKCGRRTLILAEDLEAFLGSLPKR
jgi:excisionase family DNA binding protein